MPSAAAWEQLVKDGPPAPAPGDAAVAGWRATPPGAEGAVAGGWAPVAAGPEAPVFGTGGTVGATAVVLVGPGAVLVTVARVVSLLWEQPLRTSADDRRAAPSLATNKHRSRIPGMSEATSPSVGAPVKTCP